MNLTPDQLDFACRGLRMNEKAVKIAQHYFVQGLDKKFIAEKFEVTPAYISARIARIESNLQRMLELNELEVVVMFMPKGSSTNG